LKYLLTIGNLNAACDEWQQQEQLQPSNAMRHTKEGELTPLWLLFWACLRLC